LWEQFDEEGQLTSRKTFVNGDPHGDWLWFQNGNANRAIRFDHGEVTQMDGQKVDDPLGRAYRLKQINDPHVLEALSKPARVDFMKTPLKDVAAYLSDVYRVNVSLASRPLHHANFSEDLPISATEDHATFGAMLYLLCDPHGLAATYRWGIIWITTKEDAQNWVDRTGVSGLLTTLPPDATPRDRDLLRAALETPAQFDFIDTPLGDVAQYLSDTYRVQIDVAEEFRSVPVSNSLRGVALQNALGAMCDQHSLRLRWKEGRTLVFEPQEPADK
jgi:hypothetical protein